MQSLEIDNLEDKDEYHCTLIYSKSECPDISKENFNLPFNAIPRGFALFGKEKDTLVLEIYCPDAKRLQNIFKEQYGATSDFPEYRAHITVAKNFKKNLPVDIPDFNIEFSGMMIEELG
jgi:2'-5' RNA ligase